jgi:hypothetical protein
MRPTLLRYDGGVLQAYVHVWIIGPNLIVLVVTQIPLDSPTPSQEFIVSSVRPPWIRPARKKNTIVSRSTGSVESLLQDTSEFASDPISIAIASTPFSPSTSLSPVMSTSSQREVTPTPSRPLLDRAGAGVGAGGLSMFMPSTELMSIFGDGDLDIAGLFPSSAFPGFPTDQLGDAPYEEALARRGSQGSDEMAGFVTSS